MRRVQQQYRVSSRAVSTMAPAQAAKETRMTNATSMLTCLILVRRPCVVCENGH